MFNIKSSTKILFHIVDEIFDVRSLIVFLIYTYFVFPDHKLN